MSERLRSPRMCVRCGVLTRNASGYCDQHERREWQQRGEDKRGTKARYSALFKKRRTVILSKRPRCVVPGCTAQADTVDHADGNRANDEWSNLLPFCRSHNSSKGNRHISDWLP